MSEKAKSTSINTDLRRRTPVPPSGVPQAQAGQKFVRTTGLPGFTGNLPLTAGKVINDPKYLTPAERAVLEKVNWQPGEPLPANLPADLAKAQEEILEECTTAPQDADEKIKPFVPPREMSFDDLPEARQQEIIKSIELAKKQLENAPQVGSTQHGEMIEVISKRRKAVLNKEPTLDDLITISQGTEPISPPPVVDPKPMPTPDAGGVVKEEPKNCDHCGFPYGASDTKATREDKHAFLQTILGQTRFEKTYKLFDGQMEVTFRTLTSEESDLVFRQLALDMKNETVDTGGDYWFRLMKYRLVCALAKIATEKTGPIVIPTVDKFKVDDDPNGNTKLVEITEQITNIALSNESLRRVVGQQFARFQRLVEHLEARVDDPGFWTATEEQLY